MSDAQAYGVRVGSTAVGAIITLILLLGIVLVVAFNPPGVRPVASRTFQVYDPSQPDRPILIAYVGDNLSLDDGRCVHIRSNGRTVFLTCKPIMVWEVGVIVTVPAAAK